MNLDWVLALSSGIAGALAALASQLAQKKSKKHQALTFAVVFFAVQGFFAIPFIRNSIYGMFDNRHLVKERLTTKMLPLLEIPEVKKVFDENPKEAKATMNKLVHEGIKRLDPDDLETWNRLRKKMASISPAVCAAMWTGKMKEEDMFDTFEKMTEAEMDEWVGVSMKSIKKEIEDGEVPLVTAIDFQIGVEKILSKHPVEDAVKLKDIMTNGAGDKEEDACWAMKLLMETENIEGSEKVRYLRYISMF